MANIRDFYRGNTKSYKILVDKDGVLQDITGSTITMTVKKDLTLGDDDAVIQKVAVLTDPTNGEATVTLTDADTSSAQPGKYYYDFEMVDAIGQTTTLLKGTVKVLQPVNDP